MGECDLDQMTNLSKDLREKLKDIVEDQLARSGELPGFHSMAPENG